MSDIGGTPEPEPRPQIRADDLAGPIFEITSQDDLDLWGEAGPDAEDEGELVDEDTLLRMTYELRSQVDDQVVGIIHDADWDALVEQALDQFPWES